MRCSIGKVRRGSKGATYYSKLSHEAAGLDRSGNYYLNNKKSLDDGVGRWFGTLAADMGLSGACDKKHFRALHNGYSPSGEPLSKNVAHEKRRPAFDLTFSLIKDSSVLASRSDSWRNRIFNDVASPAVDVGLQYLERHACQTRRGRDGSETLKGRGFVGSQFRHMAARSVDGQMVDPQAHLHCVVFNTTRGPDGLLRTLDSDALYRHAKTASALSSLEESYQLHKLGFTLVRDGWSFKIAGDLIPDTLREENSKRSRKIKEHAGPGASAKEMAKANWATREPKEKVDVPTLLADWGDRCDRHGLTEDRIREHIRRGHRHQVDVQQELKAASGRALKEISRTDSTLSEQKYLEMTALELLCKGVSANDCRLFVWAELERSRKNMSQELVYRGFGQDGEEVFCTREQWQLEKRLLDLAAHGRDERGHVREKHVEDAIRAKATLSEDQKKAVRGLSMKPGRIQVLVGGAGTGKTFALDAVRAAHSAAGYRCLGAALANRAAKGLATEAHMPAYNTKQLLWRIDNKRLSLDGVCLFIDEAATVDSREFGRILVEVHRATNCRLIMCGDHRQHQSVGPGGFFAGLVARNPQHEELTEIIRQRHAEDKQMVAAFRDLETRRGIESLANRGRVHTGEEVSDTQDSLVRKWGNSKTPLPERRIIASTNQQVDHLNERCNEFLESRGELSGEAVSIKGDFHARVGSRVIFRKNYSRLDLNNGDVGTVIGTAQDSLRVKLDEGSRVVTVPLSAYGREHVNLGYAATSYLSQGASYDEVFLFVHGNMTDAQQGYVMASRHRDTCFMYTTMDDAGENLSKLVRDFSRDRSKRLAHDQGDQGRFHEQQRVGYSR